MTDHALRSLADSTSVFDPVSDDPGAAATADEASVSGSSRPPDSLAEYAVEQIRNDLLMGRLRPGSRVTADGIAEQLGISHIPVREAFRFLEAQGHLQRDGRRGARIAPTSPEEATDIYLTRALLEAEANRLGIPRLTARDDARLIDLIGSMERASAEGDLRSYRVHNRAFHFIAFERSGRPWLVRFLRNLWDAAARYQTPLFVNGRWQRKHPMHHRALLDALLCRDVELVNRLMAEHRTWLVASVPVAPEQQLAPSGERRHADPVSGSQGGLVDHDDRA
jgi:DNA-binding GntR family transcriptional regulator